MEKPILVRINNKISDGRYWYGKLKGEKIFVREFGGEYVDTKYGQLIYKKDCTIL